MRWIGPLFGCRSSQPLCCWYSNALNVTDSTRASPVNHFIRTATAINDVLSLIAHIIFLFPWNEKRDGNETSMPFVSRYYESKNYEMKLPLLRSPNCGYRRNIQNEGKSIGNNWIHLLKGRKRFWFFFSKVIQFALRFCGIRRMRRTRNLAAPPPWHGMHSEREYLIRHISCMEFNSNMHTVYLHWSSIKPFNYNTRPMIHLVC